MKPRGSRASLQTFHALQASDLAAAMNEALQKIRIAPGDYSPELMAPEGPSTAGGIQAMQHLRLVSAQDGKPTIVVGYANHAEGKAELRNYEYVAAVYLQRFGRALELDRAAYDSFVGFAKQVLGALHLQTTIVGPPTESGGEAPATPARSLSKGASAFLFIALAAALIFGAWAVFARK
ncbi:MAG: hypothetical protein WBY94_27410 [Polyangiaceae bacterium]